MKLTSRRFPFWGDLSCQNDIQGLGEGHGEPPRIDLCRLHPSGGWGVNISLNILTKTLLGWSRPSCTNAVCFLDWTWEFDGTSVIGNCWNQQPTKLTIFQLHFSNEDCTKHYLRKLIYKSGFMKTVLKKTTPGQVRINVKRYKTTKECQFFSLHPAFF